MSEKRFRRLLKEYLAIYTTEYDDCYVLETIAAEDLRILRSEIDGQPERVMEAAFNYDVKDENAGVAISDRHVKIRKLNQKIGENLTFQRRRMMYVYPNGAEQKIVLNRHL